MYVQKWTVYKPWPCQHTKGKKKRWKEKNQRNALQKEQEKEAKQNKKKKYIVCRKW